MHSWGQRDTNHISADDPSYLRPHILPGTETVILFVLLLLSFLLGSSKAEITEIHIGLGQ